MHLAAPRVPLGEVARHRPSRREFDEITALLRRQSAPISDLPRLDELVGSLDLTRRARDLTRLALDRRAAVSGRMTAAWALYSQEISPAVADAEGARRVLTLAFAAALVRGQFSAAQRLTEALLGVAPPAELPTWLGGLDAWRRQVLVGAREAWGPLLLGPHADALAGFLEPHEGGDRAPLLASAEAWVSAPSLELDHDAVLALRTELCTTTVHLRWSASETEAGCRVELDRDDDWPTQALRVPPGACLVLLGEARPWVRPWLEALDVPDTPAVAPAPLDVPQLLAHTGAHWALDDEALGPLRVDPDALRILLVRERGQDLRAAVHQLSRWARHGGHALAGQAVALEADVADLESSALVRHLVQVADPVGWNGLGDPTTRASLRDLADELGLSTDPAYRLAWLDLTELASRQGTDRRVLPVVGHLLAEARIQREPTLPPVALTDTELADAELRLELLTDTVQDLCGACTLDCAAEHPPEELADAWHSAAHPAYRRRSLPSETPTT